jgi:hypothetical protein
MHSEDAQKTDIEDTDRRKVRLGERQSDRARERHIYIAGGGGR